MTLSPCRANLLPNPPDPLELYQFLLACQEKSQLNNSSQIVSFSQEIEPIDPLATFQHIAQPNQHHFYWENRRKKEAIAGYGIAQVLTIDSEDRFERAKKLIDKCQQQTLKEGDLKLPFSGPHFFCNFTFFSNHKNCNTPFPSATIFLPLLQIARKKDHCVVVINLAINPDSDPELMINKLRQQIKTINWFSSLKLDLRNNYHKKFIPKAQAHNPNHFKSAVASALKSIRKNQFSKIVLAHALDVVSTEPFKLVESLSNLRNRHPDCYIFSISNGNGNHFIGASPERLIGIHNNQLVTDALAGSAPRGKTRAEDTDFAERLLKSEKERREHQAVSKYITERLGELGLRPQQLSVQLLQLSNIQHIWTPIHAQLPEGINPLDIVAQLHPTPAVAGVPTSIACEQIRSYETFDRSLYAAPLGWVDYQGNGEFIVGIRSALIRYNRARLYAGAGIVAGSEPNKEFTEVQMKLQAMLKALI